MDNGNGNSKMKPTKKWLLAQMESLKTDIKRCEGGLILCSNMLSSGCYVEEEEQKEGEKAV